MTATSTQPLLLREADVVALVGFAPRTIRQWVSCGKFPRPVKLDGDGMRAAKRWLRAEVEEWVAKLAEKRA